MEERRLFVPFLFLSTDLCALMSSLSFLCADIHSQGKCDDE
jgi:hypothetical protein